MADLAILIPTLGRADKLVPLLANIAATTETPHTVYFVMERTDTASHEALRGIDAVRVIGDFGSCAKAMNAGYRRSSEPYIFTGNDDLWFRPGWDLAALAALEEPGKHVCGTNDAHGRMTCFAMVERAYIEEHSGVFDQPATLYHSYASQYVDTEFADFAKARGVWTEAPDSITEHQHWEFGKADRDHPNYLKAHETCAADHATYLARKPQWEAAAA